MRIKFSYLLRAGLLYAALFSVLLSSPGHAQTATYPDKGRPIKIIVPTGPGSAIDLLARAHGKALGDVAGLNVIVENKPGAEGVPGVQAFMQAPADGYTMLVVSSSAMALNPIMIANLPYDPLKDFVPLTTFSKAGLVMNLGAGTQFKTLRELVTSAKSNPGKYTCATSTTSLRMACEFLQASAGIKLLLVPYKTTAAAMLAVASGETDIVFVDAGSSIAQWQTGRVRGIAVTTSERLALLPKLPTTREEGVPDFLMTAWYGAYFKTGTPPQIAARMRDLLREAGAKKEVKDALASFVHEPLYLTGDEVTAMNRREIEQWAKLVREQGIKFNN
jgi:tripartite-type tricarboxylate transporter receptor subunit TctC